MKQENFRLISESFSSIHPLLVSHFSRPIKDKERELLPPGYFHLLHCMRHMGKPEVSMSELSQATCISKPNLTVMVDRLCLQGLLVRCTDPRDRRIVNVAMTEKTERLLHGMHEKMHTHIAAKLADLEDEDIQKFLHAMNDIGEVLRKL